LKSTPKVKISIIAIFPLIILLLILNCSGKSVEWLDSGYNYLCSDCRYKMWYDMLGECEHCGGMTESISFKYCYGCAKELDLCQMYGAQR